MNKQNIQSHCPPYEGIFINVLLTAVGGYLDVYSYLLRGKVFANAQTGNLVLMGISIAEGNSRQALYYLIPIVTFFLGILTADAIKGMCPAKGIEVWKQFVLLMELILLSAIGFCPLTVPHAVVNVTISFVCSVQVHSFRRVHNLAYASTMCTGNLRSAGECFFRFVTQRDKQAAKDCCNYFIILTVFFLGAAMGTVLTGIWKERSIWVCSGIILTAFLFLSATDGKKARKSQ